MKNSQQILRFIIIGTLNAFITALVVWLMMDVLHFNYIASNIAGYTAALLNNFFWSKFWIFQSGKGHYLPQALFFLLAFICAYGSQFIFLLWMVELLDWNEYVSQFIGLFIYGFVNFLMNKKITFHSKEQSSINCE